VTEQNKQSDQETPHPPATPEFAYVVPGGPAHRYAPSAAVMVTKFSVGQYDNNVYVVASNGEAVIVDGAAEADRILAAVKGLAVKAVLETHNHFDHTGALRELVRALDVPVLAHPDDPMPVAAEPLRDGDRVEVGSAVLEVLHTPGHTPGSLSFRLGDHVFTGDTLFPAGPGNTRGDRAAFAEIMRSLDRLFSLLPDHARISPGHGLDTTIGRERPYVEVWRARGW
jgi:glyoxylase-like metal-dependent hydrolase (beta-lactamase superfamily II)